MTATAVSPGRATRADRLRITAILGAIVTLHVFGWTLYLYYSRHLATAGALGGAGTLAYVLGVRHAFDADHIAAIDDTTRLMLQRGRRPVGVGFFFAMGHSTVVLALALLVALAAGTVGTGIDTFQRIGGVVSQLVALSFLLLVATLNALMLAGVITLWRRVTRGQVDEHELETQLLNQGLLNRMLGRRARTLIRSSWHMYPVGILFGLGLETPSEVTLLALSASAASHGGLPLLAVLMLPLLFAAGMSAFDTANSLLMTHAYSWAYRNPARRLYYNIAATGMTVFVAAFIASVYLMGLLASAVDLPAPLAVYARLADHFELLGYLVVGAFLTAWLAAAAIWRYGRFEERHRRHFVRSEALAPPAKIGSPG
jgi:high-affinity nickel-transport protein